MCIRDSNHALQLHKSHRLGRVCRLVDRAVDGLKAQAVIEGDGFFNVVGGDSDMLQSRDCFADIHGKFSLSFYALFYKPFF